MKNKTYNLKDKDKLTLTGKQLRELKENIIKEQNYIKNYVKLNDVLEIVKSWWYGQKERDIDEFNVEYAKIYYTDIDELYYRLWKSLANQKGVKNENPFEGLADNIQSQQTPSTIGQGEKQSGKIDRENALTTSSKNTAPESSQKLWKKVNQIEEDISNMSERGLNTTKKWRERKKLLLEIKKLEKEEVKKK